LSPEYHNAEDKDPIGMDTIDLSKTRWKLTKRRLWIILSVGTFVLLLLGLWLGIVWSCPAVDHLVRTNPGQTAMIRQRIRQGHLPKNFSLHANWTKIAQIPDLLLKTIVVAEDGSFFGHEGVDWHEVRQAMRQKLKGRRLRGASTITQQLAKNLFLSENRSLIRKLREWALADELEDVLSKNRILELYLNCIEFGKGVFGIGMASRRFFHKPPSALSLSEMVRLAAVIPAPLRLAPTQADENLERRSRVILHRLLKYKYIKERQQQRTEEALDLFFKTTL
jgi:monofunctional biosynthetic peptidoglycan transglycosylase